MDFNKRIKPALRRSIFSMEDQGFVVWCGTITKGKDGLYYLYFSFWPMNKGHDAWVTHSQIGYAVSESPIGPFEFGGIALTGSGGAEWDRDCVHNPAVIELDGVYYLYYMGNYGDGSYWGHRNNQRIGVAYSDNPKGPFKRLDKPIIDITPSACDSLMTSNPSVAVGKDGKIYMMYKAVSNQGIMPKGGAVVCAMAVSEHPLGTFVKQNKPIMINPENDWSVEDPFIWFEEEKFYALAKDFQGYFTKSGKSSVALFESEDGINWGVSELALAFKTEIVWEDGVVESLQKMERPQMWLDEDGKPKVLCCACARMEDKEKIHTFNVQIEIE